ncbi:CU044_5270 family protein [Nonomuraea sp. SYSU D8015]|uniref:CU044_5270 family protein n=1 Tax=Nonomuraea sp. SYSU D8015 TaxID=2593644 RepID=UPI00166087EB|nr:CU044_5270 family protein [Nonomuraea sp. SYSU D8015]
MTDRMFAELKPAALDELTEEAYRRRRSADLAHAFAAPRTPRRRSRRPFLLVAGTVVAGLAAAAAVVVVSGQSPAALPNPRQAPIAAPSETRTPSARPVNARSFLLAAASTAMRDPARAGRYWYVRERTFTKVRVVPSEYEAKAKALIEEMEKKEKELEGAPEGLAATKKEFEAKFLELKTTDLPYLAYSADTRESWRAMKKGEPGRSLSHPVTVTFGSPEDEAAWKAAGSPKLVESTPRVRLDDTERILSIDNPSLTLQNLSDLPTTEGALKGELEALWKRSPNTAQTDKRGYLWQTGVDLMTAPITPATRSALFKVLADQPGITSQGQVADTMGRTGAALSVSTADAISYRLIIDGETAELLQYEVWEKDKPLLKVTLEQMGWTDTPKARPEG